MVDTIAPVEVAQAATQIYNGPPANESGRMCLRIFLRGSRKPLGFCNRYVGTGVAGDEGLAPPELASAASADVTSAFGDLEQVDFATLHVAHVVADIDASRGLAEAAIVSAHAPGRVKAGRVVRVRLVVRVYRGPLRTLSFPLRIPAGAKGAISVTINGPMPPPPASSSGLSSSLAVTLSGGGAGSGSGGSPGISSVAELRQAIALIPAYDGLIANLPHHVKRHVFRDPSLLVTGRATLAFDVAR